MSLMQQLETERQKTLNFFRGMSKENLQIVMAGFDQIAGEAARRWKLLAVSLHKEANGAVSPPTSKPVEPVSPDSGRDISRERFFKLIYVEVRARVINGDILPTIRPVTDAVTDVIRHHTRALGLQPSLIGKPERQRIAEKILDKLADEAVLERNPEPKFGAPKYLLASRWANRPVPEGMA